MGVRSLAFLDDLSVSRWAPEAERWEAVTLSWPHLSLPSQLSTVSSELASS